MSKQSTKKERLNAAKDPATLPAMLAEALHDQTTGIRLAAALNPSTPGEALGLALLSDRSAFVQCAAAENISTLPSALTEALKCPDPRVRWYVAQNPSTPAVALTEFRTALGEAIHSLDSRQRRVAAGNPFTPPDALAAALQDNNLLVRWRAARNPSTPAEALVTISGTVRWPAAFLRLMSFNEWRNRIVARLRSRSSSNSGL